MKKVICLLLLIATILGGFTIASATVDMEEIKKYEVHYDTEYDRVVALIYLAAEIEELDGDLMVAIWRLETGNGTSQAFVQYHNFYGGMGKNGQLMQFGTEPQGLESFVNCMKWYRDNGMATPEAMEMTYCGEGWARKIREIMEEMK